MKTYRIQYRYKRKGSSRWRYSNQDHEATDYLAAMLKFKGVNGIGYESEIIKVWELAWKRTNQ